MLPIPLDRGGARLYTQSMHIAKYFCLFAVAGLAGCTPIKKTAPAEAADRAVTCEAGADCEEKWHRAGEWVDANSAYEVKVQSGSLIETTGPLGLDDHLAFTVTRKPGFKKPDAPPAAAAPLPDPHAPPAPAPVPAKDMYDIALFTRCNNWFGCVPSQHEAKALFAEFVMGAAAAAKPVLGVKVVAVSPDMAQKIKMPGIQGVAVTEVTPNSLADKAGLHNGDIIVRYDGAPVATEAALLELVSKTPPGQHASLDIIRGRVQQVLTVNF